MADTRAQPQAKPHDPYPSAPRRRGATATTLRRAAAECVGTFGLVFAGCGAVIVDATTGGGVSHVGVALTFGLIIMTMIYATGHISGAHFNPAVTLGFAATRHFPLTLVPVYLAAQFGGAILASRPCGSSSVTSLSWGRRCPPGVLANRSCWKLSSPSSSLLFANLESAAPFRHGEER